MITTINISLPKSMYEDAKRYMKKRNYASFSELIRDILRDLLYPKVDRKADNKVSKSIKPVTSIK